MPSREESVESTTGDAELLTDVSPITPRARVLTALRTEWVSVSIVAFFVVLSSFGITNSSIGIEALSSGPGTQDGVVLGGPRAIRSDEWIRSSPWRLGTTIRSSEYFRTPLAEDPSLNTGTPDDGVVEYIVFFDGTAIALSRSILPDTLLFALYWWLPVIVVLLAMPRWLQVFGVRRGLSWLAAILVIFSPVVAWWSMWPLQPLAWSLLASLLAIRSVDRVCVKQRVDLLAILLAAGSGVFLARTALSYFPWALPLGAVVLVPTLIFMVKRDQVRSRILMLGIAAVVGVLALAATLLENWSAVSALANSVYPGSRVHSGTALNPGLVFGAQHLGVLRSDPPIATLNQSELSTAYTILIVPTVILLTSLPGRAWRHMRSWATIGSLAILLLALLTWILTDVPDTIGEHIPALNRVPPPRLAQIVGIPVVILFALVLDRYQRFKSDDPLRIVTVGSAGVLTLVVSAWSGSLLKASELPTLRLGSIWFVSIFLAIAVVAVILSRVPVLSSLLLAIGAAAIVLFTNPVMLGFGGLRSGPAVDLVVSQSREDDGPIRWTTDNFRSNAVLMANAISSLSGQQWTGPNEDAWRILDPEERQKASWNRGAAFIAVVPVLGLPAAEISSPQQDIIVVRIDPCDSALDTLQVTHMMTSEPIESVCLTEIGSYDLGGTMQFGYRRSTG